MCTWSLKGSLLGTPLEIGSQGVHPEAGALSLCCRGTSVTLKTRTSDVSLLYREPPLPISLLRDPCTTTSGKSSRVPHAQVHSCPHTARPSSLQVELQRAWYLGGVSLALGLEQRAWLESGVCGLSCLPQPVPLCSLPIPPWPSCNCGHLERHQCSFSLSFKHTSLPLCHGRF